MHYVTWSTVQRGSRNDKRTVWGRIPRYGDSSHYDL
jgi:hypothetical protein